MSEQELLQMLASRGYGLRHGIGLKKSYLSEVDACLAGGNCKDMIGGLSTDQWQALLKDSSDRLVYTDPDHAQIKKYKSATGTYLMTFEATLTSVREDRDGDILESMGAEVDKDMPLLWQHLTPCPTGKMLRVTRQNSKRVNCEFGVLKTGNGLGDDTCLFIENGVLRMSHGFKPKAWTARYEKDDTDKKNPIGFHVQKFEIYEGSTVSVPSNPDAVISNWQRQKLHSPLTKAMAQRLYESKPRMVKGGWVGERVSAGLEAVTMPVTLEVTTKFVDAAPGPAKACGCGAGKSADADDGAPEAVSDADVKAGGDGADDGKPIAGWHACRIKNPSLFESGSFVTQKRKHAGKSYNVIMGKLKGETTLTEQSYRYATGAWDEAAARSHCKDHKGRFEPAKAEGKAAGPTKVVKGLHGKLPLMMHPIDGSWEAISCALEEAAEEYLEEKKLISDYDDCLLIGTFNDRAVVASCSMWGSQVKKSWELSWAMKDGKPEISGEPKEVELTTTIQSRAAAVSAAKEGAGVKARGVKALGLGAAPAVKGSKISKKNRDRVSDANDFVKEVSGKGSTGKTDKVLLEKSSSLLDEVLADAADGEGDDAVTADDTSGEAKGLGGLGRKLLAGLVLADDKGVSEVEHVHREIGLVLGALKRRQDEAKWQEIAKELGL